MAAATGLRDWIGAPFGDLGRFDARGVADGIGQGLEIIGVRDGRRVGTVVSHDLPPAGNRQANRVLFAEVIGVRLGEAGERADDRGRVGIHVGEGRNRRTGAATSAAAA
jgi:hypothetical protein